MDVRCEKCQTEYELDESRLKPGGVTVKCTNCGHMFKIRKRTPTNVGLPVVDPTRTRPASGRQPVVGNNDKTVRADSHGDPMMSVTDQGSGPAGERQWMVRLENGETKTCRELATLQQWIVAGVATRESLISRSGKTWKRLGDITELGQYFAIADEARTQRSMKPTPTPKPGAATMLGVSPVRPDEPGMLRGAGAEDDAEDRSTGNFRARTPTPPPPPPPARTATPVVGSPNVNPLAQTEISAQMPVAKPPAGVGRATAGWASNEVKHSDSMAAMPQGPRGGRLSASPDEPAFAGRVRLEPGAESSFQTGKVRLEDDDDMIPGQRGSRAGMWIALLSLLVIGAAAGAVYMFVFKKHDQVAKPAVKQDAGVVAVTPADASLTVTPVPVDAAPEISPIDQARGELVADVEARLKTAADGLAAKDDPASLALRARLLTTLAQSLNERAGLLEKAEGDKLRKQAKQIVIDAAPLAQRAFKAAADDASANLAMADVLRLQGKSAKDVQRYLDTAKAKAGSDKELAGSAGLGGALLAMRDGKLDDAQKQLAAVDAPDDQRVKVALALVALIQNKPADAKPIVDQILATQPDHEAGKALAAKLETTVAKTDPLPPEDKHAGSSKTNPTPTPTPTGGGGDYDSLLAKANKLAETNCTKALELYAKALEQKPNGVEALAGMGYCNLDAKQFSSAFSKFRAALAVSPRYEPALGGIAETYQRQGNKDQAIEAWHKYLDAFPGSPKAKKQLEILGDTGGSEQPKPPPPADPVKPPQPTPPASSSDQPQKPQEPAPAAGSGSG